MLQAAFPEELPNGVFAFYRQVVETDEAGHYDCHYQANGRTHHLQVAAERRGKYLVVGLTDTGAQPHSTAEIALRES